MREHRRCSRPTDDTRDSRFDAKCARISFLPVRDFTAKRSTESSHGEHGVGNQRLRRRRRLRKHLIPRATRAILVQSRFHAKRSRARFEFSRRRYIRANAAAVENTCRARSFTRANAFPVVIERARVAGDPKRARASQLAPLSLVRAKIRDSFSSAERCARDARSSDYAGGPAAARNSRSRDSRREPGTRDARSIE